MESPSSPVQLVVGEIGVILHKITLDTTTKDVRVHSEAAVGMSDGSTRPGVIVTHFFNGKQGPEAITDDFGVATLHANIPLDCFDIGEKNILTVRVRGSIRNASLQFQVLTDSTANVLEAGDREIKSRDYGGYSKEDREVFAKVAIYLSNQDFSNCGGVKVRAKLNNKDLGEGITNAEGHCIISWKDRYVVRIDHRRDSIRGEASVKFDRSDPLVITIDGFPENFAIKGKTKT